MFSIATFLKTGEYIYIYLYTHIHMVQVSKHSAKFPATFKLQIDKNMLNQ